jgi:gliding motility-associated-like protein
MPAFINNYNTSGGGSTGSFTATISDGCLGDTTYITLNNASSADSVYWDLGDGDTSNYFSPAHVYGSVGSYYLTAHIWNQCSGIDTIYDTVTIVASTSIQQGFDTLLCQGDPILFDVGGMTGSYSWSTGDTTSSITTSTPGIYTVAIQDACGITNDTFSLSNVTMPVSFLSDTSICEGDNVTVDLISMGGSFLWQDGSTAQFRTLSTGGLYWAEFTDSGCTVIDSMTLTTYSQPTINSGTNLTICIGTSIQLTSGPAGLDFTWSTGETGISIMGTPGAAYSVWGVDVNGCYSDTATYNIFERECILPCRGDSSIFVPNVFTPDGPSNNIFYVRGSSVVRIRALQIFNRWGEVVFDLREANINDKSMGWDGTYKGSPLPSQVFAYYLVAECEEKEEIIQSGNITLLR